MATITIDKESRHRARMPIEIDNMAARYKTTNGQFTFTSPDLWSIDKNLFYLLRNSVVKKFDPQYKMKPDYLAYDEYGTVQLAQLLMYVNGVSSLEDFDLTTVVIPTFAAIIEMTKDKYSKKKPAKLESIDW